MCSLRLDTMCVQSFRDANCSHIGFSEPMYPSQLHTLVVYINQPKFPLIFMQFLYKCCHPKEQFAPPTIEECSVFNGAIKVYHSTVTTYYVPSDLSRSGGLWHKQICSMPNFFGHPCYVTVFVVTDNSWLGMEGMEIGCVLLFFSFEYQCKTFLCALINWFVHIDGCDLDTQMWFVRQEVDHHGRPTLEVIHLDSIAQCHNSTILFHFMPTFFFFYFTLWTSCDLFNHRITCWSHDRSPDLSHDLDS